MRTTERADSTREQCDVVVLHLGLAVATGGVRRMRMWEALARSVGASCVSIRLLRKWPIWPGPAAMWGVARGRLVPEVLAWSWGAVRGRVQRLRPRVCVAVTPRAYRTELLSLCPSVVLDHVDELSLSYSQRAGLARNPAARLGYRLLGKAHARFERDVRGVGSLQRVTAGYRDASRLQAQWLPTLIEPPAATAIEGPTHDILFSGNLTYGPNVDALRWLSSMWPRLLQRRPETTLLVAGRGPADQVLPMATRWGWELAVDFTNLSDVCARAKLAVAPIRHTAGIQTKVLDAAAHGLAQVVSPAATEGFAPGFPFVVARDEAEWVDAIVHLLADDNERAALGEHARDHVLQHYSPGSWSSWFRGLF